MTGDTQAPESLPPVPTQAVGGGNRADADSTRAMSASAMAAAQNLARQDGTQPSRFTVLRRHAQGGLGEVLIAQDAELGREVAYKRIKPQWSASAQARRRFLREAEITAKLEHPGIVPIYGLVQDADGQPCYAMRFIEGESLKQAIRDFHRETADKRTERRDTQKEDPETDKTSLTPSAQPRTPGNPASAANRVSVKFQSLPFRQLLQRFVTVCQTVAFAHSKGVIHRDLKPANVMLGKYGETLLVDWGLAKDMREPASDGVGEEAKVSSATALSPSHSLTQMGQALGTPAYMSPEQAAGQWDAVGPASDIYSLGAVLYEILTGHVPVAIDDPAQVMKSVQEGRFPRPRARCGSVPKSLEAICLKAMAKSPADRFGSASALADDIEHWLADEPVSAFAEPWTVRTGRWLRQHRALTAVTGALLASAVAILVIVVVLQDRARVRIESEQARTAAERDLARKNLALAKSAVDQTVTRVAENPRLKEADFLALRKELLASAVPMYEEFVRQRSDDPALEAERGRSYRRLAAVHAEMGERREAVNDYTQTKAIFEQLVAEFPAVAKYREDLATCQIFVSTLLRELGRGPEAANALHHAEELLTRLSTENPGEPVHRQQLGTCHNNIGNLLLTQGRPADGEKAYRQAIEVRAKLTAEFPKEPRYRHDVAQTHLNLGVALERQGQRGPASEEYRQAIEIQSRLAEEFPQSPDYRWQLTASQNNLGMLLDVLGERTESEKVQQEAVDILTRLVADFPSVPRYRRDLANSCMNVGRLKGITGRHEEAVPFYAKAVALLEPLVAQIPSPPADKRLLLHAYWGQALSLENSGQPAEAVKAWDRAIALSTGPTSTELRLSRLFSLAHAGEHAKAIAEITALATAPGADGKSLYELATACAGIAALAKESQVHEQYAARAVELLRQAVAKGFKDIDHLKNDDELKVLRDREDFKKLLAGLQTDAGKAKDKN